MGHALNSSSEIQPNRVFLLPSQLACFLLAMGLLTSQVNPCDATSVSMGSSLTFILLTIGIGFLVAIDSVLNRTEQAPSRLFGWLFASFVVFGFWLWICTSFVPGRGNARFATNGCWQWIAEGILTLSIAKLVSRYRIGGALVALMLGSAAGTVASAGYQYFFSMPALRKMFAEDPLSFYEKMGVVSGSSDAMQLSSRLGSLEPTGPFALTNSLAGLMATWLIFIIVLRGGQLASSYKNPLHKKPSWWGALLSCVLVIAFFMTLLLTKGRSAWLATIVAIIAACVLHPSIRNSGWVVATRFRTATIGLSVLVVIAVGSVLVRDPMVVAEAGKSLSYRFDYWRGAVTLIGAQPWTGYGVANFQQNYNRIKVVTASESPADPHSFILETAVAGGLPLLAILIAILVILFLRMIDVSSVDSAPKSPFAATDSVVDNSNLAILFGALSGCMGIMLFESLVSDTDAIISSFLFVGVTLLVGAAVVRRHWFYDDANSVATCLISVLGILIHLLASGGWMQPGIMNSFCVLVGLAFGIRARQSIESKSMLAAGSHSQWKKTRIIPVACLLLVVVMAVDFARTMCLPVLAASGVKSLIANDPDSVLDPNQWLEIIQLDPLDPELPSLAASQLVELLLKNNLSDSSKQKYAALFDACCENYLKRDANQWMPYAECGRWNAILADNETTAATDAIFGKSRKELAYQYFLRSTELYPNSAQTQLQAAVIAAWCGKLQESRLHVSKAEDIDRETPHADRKLSAAVVVFPKQLESAFGPLEVRESLSHPGYSKGEPIMEWLRTKVR